MVLADFLLWFPVAILAFVLVIRPTLLFLLDQAASGSKWSGLWFVAFLGVFVLVFGVKAGYAGWLPSPAAVMVVSNTH